MLRLPRLARCGLGIWQSISGTFRARHSATRRASATFEASVSRVNMDSPKNARPSRYAIESADQAPVVPGLERMREPAAVQEHVGRVHVAGDPGAGHATRAGRRRLR